MKDKDEDAPPARFMLKVAKSTISCLMNSSLECRLAGSFCPLIQIYAEFGRFFFFLARGRHLAHISSGESTQRARLADVLIGSLLFLKSEVEILELLNF